MLDPSVLDDIIRCIAEVARPQRIILFGSVARGDINPHSDVDLMVVRDGAHRRQLAKRIHKSLHGAQAPVDVVVVTPRDIERYGDTHALVIKATLNESRVVYETP